MTVRSNEPHLSQKRSESDTIISGSTRNHELGNMLFINTLAAIDDAVVILDEQDRIIIFNRSAESLTGYSCDEVKNRPFKEVISFEAVTLSNLNPDIQTAIPFEFKTGEKVAKIPCKNGSDRYIAYKRIPIVDPAGQQGVNMVIFRDVSDKYKMGKEFIKFCKLESVGLLAGGIAHDFNNILTGIITNLFMARMSIPPGSDPYNLIEEAEKAAFRASRLTKQLLTFSKGGSPVLENASIKHLIEESVGFCLSGSNVDYHLEIPDDLFPVHIDRGQIDQVLNNLIINADQAMPEGGTINISAANLYIETSGLIRGDSSGIQLPLKAGEYVQIAIEDSGVGIPEEHLQNIFDPYFTTKEGGSGLGLSTSYSIIRKHDGYILVNSTPGKGSCFTFFLPAQKIEEHDNTIDTISPLTGRGSILIMDDDVVVRTVMEKMLKKSGFSVACVSNGAEAIDCYTERFGSQIPFSLVIMDLTIPGGMGGKDAVKKLKLVDPDARVIVFSGYSNDPIMSKYKEFGFDGVLPKPFTIEEFNRALQNTLS